ncbi:MAG: hypothetical protein RL522_1135 [Pseudomonadota bacterium]|jgi:hypothetical protein
MTSGFLFLKTAHRAFKPSVHRLWLAAMVCAAAGTAHASDASCISAGRLDGEGRWAPQFQEVRLLDEAGRTLATRSKADLSRVRGVELTQPALLSACAGDRGLTREERASTKAPVPAAKPGRLVVDSVAYAKLQAGGELVELKVQVTPEQVVTITR